MNGVETPDQGGMAGGARATRPWKTSVSSDCAPGSSTIVTRPGWDGPRALLECGLMDGPEEYVRTLEGSGAGGRLFSVAGGTRDRRELYEDVPRIVWPMLEAVDKGCERDGGLGCEVEWRNIRFVVPSSAAFILAAATSRAEMIAEGVGVPPWVDEGAAGAGHGGAAEVERRLWTDAWREACAEACAEAAADAAADLAFCGNRPCSCGGTTVCGGREQRAKAVELSVDVGGGSKFVSEKGVPNFGSQSVMVDGLSVTLGTDQCCILSEGFRVYRLFWVPHLRVRQVYLCTGPVLGTGSHGQGFYTLH